MFQRDIENWYKFNFEGVGRYGVPALLPEYIETKYFIPFNYAKSCKDPDQCGVHFFLHDYQFKRLWDMPERYKGMMSRFSCVCTPDYEQLAARIRAGENVGNNMAVLYDQVKDFIHAMAYKYHGQGELEDLEQEGFLALYDAIDHYEADQGVKFLTYASHWIRQRMQKYIQNTGSPLRLSAGRQ